VLLSTILPSDTSLEELPSSRLLKISPVPKLPRKYLIGKITNFFLSLKKIIISRKIERSKEDIKSNGREIESVNSANILV
jgi:hypothetical protein